MPTSRVKPPVEAVPVKKMEIKIPKTLGGCADRLYHLKDLISKAEGSVTTLREEQVAIKDYLIENLPKSAAEGVTGKEATATIKKKPVPQCKDWDKFHAYIKKTGDFSLLQRRLADGAVNEQLAAKVKLPGIEVFNALSVSITKR